MEQSYPQQEAKKAEEEQHIQEQQVLSDWDTNRNSSEPVLLSDFEHKAFLVVPSKQMTIMSRPDDVLDKDMSLSILDQEQAFIYGIKAACSEEWLYLGFPKLAERRKAHIKIKLGLFRSVAGIERFLQTGQANVTTEMDLLSNSITPQQAVEKKTGSNAMGNIKKMFS